MKTVIYRRVKVFCKLAIVFVVMGLSDHYTVTAPKCYFNEKQCNTRVKR